jgi:hypothetical protein
MAIDFALENITNNNNNRIRDWEMGVTLSHPRDI